MRLQARGLALCGLAFAACAVGCVDRRIHITSDPSGAAVILNDAEVGVTPCEVNFTYFGTYDVRLHKAGYEPLVTRAKAEAPFHEWPGVDLAAAAVPVTKRTRIDWHFTMTPEVVDDAGLLSRATELRGRAVEGTNAESKPTAVPAQ
jgi:hypothetical protein